MNVYVSEVHISRDILECQFSYVIHDVTVPYNQGLFLELINRTS